MNNEVIRIGQVVVKFILESSDTNGAMAVFEFSVPAGARVPIPHSHRDFDETIYGLEGALTFTVEGKPIDIEPGGSCFIPRGAVHGFDNKKPIDAKALAIITPALLAPQYFHDMAAIINAGGPPDVEALKAAMLKHGLVPAMPKPA
jgi:quercetin dioxygenase-like cupin family protein